MSKFGQKGRKPGVGGAHGCVPLTHNREAGA